MKHFFYLLIVFILSGTVANAQNYGGDWHLGFAVDGGIPTTNVFKTTLGGDIRLQKDFGDHLSATLTGGFTHFFEKDHFNNYLQYGSPYNVIPVKMGVKAFLTNNLYLGAEAGVGFGFEQWGNSFVYSPSIGLAFNNGIDISVKYEDFTRDKNTKDIALRFGYGIDFTKRKTQAHATPIRDKDWLIGFDVNPGFTSNSTPSGTLGADVNLNKQLNNWLGLTFSAGFNHYFKIYNSYYFNVYQEEGFVGVKYNNTSRNVFTVAAGPKVYLGNQLYAAGEAGAAFASNGTTAFYYSPSLGLSYSNGFDIGVKYENYSGYDLANMFVLKVGYKFKL